MQPTFDLERYLDNFGDEEGLEIARRIDAHISRLPGLDWFNLLTEMRAASVAGA